MAITTADGWFAAAKQAVGIRKTTSITTVAAQQFSMFDVAGNPGAGSLTIGNITAGLVPTDADTGYPTINAFGGAATGYLAQASFRSSVPGGCILYDRLYHAGSVSLLALATTTFASQPVFTSRIPGGTNYNWLEIQLEINAAVSATATTVSVTYTNEAGTTGRSTGAISVNGLITRRVVAMPLQAGDKGVQKIESVIVGGTVATSGTFNVILARRLAEFDIRVANALDQQAWDGTGAPQVWADSALWHVVQPDGTTGGAMTVNTTIING